ncbi:unnamed protein product [Linum tenue]|uniref:Uncharacterized protein n=1 Tax=Linum tenue TaxID=586396 RepID=A0AAV0LV34_9ROSI|nr:unnamed protein product [Linum tenue]
MRWREGGN